MNLTCPSALRIAFIGATLNALQACSSVPSSSSPQEYLDPQTAATVSIVGRPLVFARERPERAVHMRDYVTMAAAAVNRSGKIEYVVIAYFWTTLDAHGRSSESSEQSASQLDVEHPVIAADDRRIELSLEGHSAQDAGIGVSLHAPPGRSVAPNVYGTDLATLRFLAAAHHLALLQAPDSDSRYEIWDDQRPALEALVRLLSGTAGER